MNYQEILEVVEHEDNLQLQVTYDYIMAHKEEMCGLEVEIAVSAFSILVESEFKVPIIIAINMAMLDWDVVE